MSDNVAPAPSAGQSTIKVKDESRAEQDLWNQTLQILILNFKLALVIMSMSFVLFC